MNLNEMIAPDKSSKTGCAGKVILNPSRKDMLDVSKMYNKEEAKMAGYRRVKAGYPLIRFLAYPDKKLFVFSPECMHHLAAKKIGRSEETVWVKGIAKMDRSGRWIAYDIKNLYGLTDRYKHGGHIPSKKILEKILSCNWRWVDKYIIMTIEIRKFYDYLNKKGIKIKKNTTGIKLIRQNSKINERWYSSYKSAPRYADGTVEVFINPTSKEMRQAANKYGQIRFSAFKKPNRVFVFNSDSIHSEFFMRGVRSKYSGDSFHGDGHKSGNQWYIDNSDQYREMKSEAMKGDISSVNELEDFFLNKWDFLSKYFVNASSFIKKLKIKAYDVLKKLKRIK